MFFKLSTEVGFLEIGNFAELFEADGVGIVFFEIKPDGFHTGIKVFPGLFGEGWRSAAEFDEKQAKESIDGGFASEVLLLLFAVEQSQQASDFFRFRKL